MGTQDTQIFYRELESELSKGRSGSCHASILIIEIAQKEGGVDSQAKDGSNGFAQSVSGILRESLRNKDQVFYLGGMRFGAILPNTPEVGAERSAWRLKRTLHDKLEETLGLSGTASIGVLCLEEPLASTQEVLTRLEKELEIEKTCQTFLDAKIQTAGDLSPTGHVIVVTAEANPLRPSEDTAWTCQVAPKYQTEWEGMLSKGPGLVFLGSDLGLAERLSIARKIRLNRSLDHILLVSIEDSGHKEDRPEALDIMIDDVVSPKGSLQDKIDAYLQLSQQKHLLGQVRHFQGILDTVGLTAHKLNQPLQVIIGKLEILLLTVEEEPAMIAAIKDIRSQALRAAEINQKIGRLVRQRDS